MINKKIIKNKKVRQILLDVERISRRIIGGKLVKIILYGSMARGGESPSSDIDIMLLVNDNRENIRKYDNKISEHIFNLSLKHDIVLSVMLKANKQFNSYSDILPFYRNVQKEGIEIYGQ